MASVLTVTSPATSTASPAGSFTLSASVSAANTAFEILSLTIGGAGNTTVTSPSGATLAMIIPPTTNAVQLTLKGIAGDTGIPISPSQPTGPITFFSNAGTNTFVLTSAGAITGPVQIIFF